MALPGDSIYDQNALKQIESLIEAEQRYLAAQKNGLDKHVWAPGSLSEDKVSGRRGFLIGTTALAGAGVAGMLPRMSAAATPPGAFEFPVPADSTKVQGRATGDDGGYGSRSQFETVVRWRYPTPTKQSSWTMTPLDGSFGIITPSGLHFERHHAGIPTIDSARHHLVIHGMVKTPKKYSMADLRRFPSVSRIYFVECSGNGLTEWAKPTLKTVQGTHGLLSTSEWTGVPLSTVLKEVGVQGGAKWVLAEGDDAAVMTRSIPIEKCWDNALLAYGQNGEAIRPEQGYPLRLILPGWEGNTQIKWLRRLEVSDVPFMTREETSKYTDLLGDGKARQFTFVMEAKSVITYPSGEMTLPGPGFYEITGLAWSGRGAIERVEVSTDGAKTWQVAALQQPVMRLATARFRLPWVWDGRPAILQSRCIDETGYVQPTIKQLGDVRGMSGPFGSIYHLNGIQSWQVSSDGKVANVHHY
jgi:sulfane dehydrogenase subunit SoxC